jgi:nucleoside-diphosphate-sugar epimerase
MEGTILVAGASGVVGRRLTPLLQQRGYAVVGTTRSAARASALARSGLTPAVLDAFDRRAVFEMVAAVRPAVVIHQLTDLSGGLAPDRRAETLTRNARIRSEGTRNLVDAAHATGVRRLVAQSIVWVYAPGPEPHTESDPLDVAAAGTRAITVQGVVALEQAVLDAAPLAGVVLRYGWLYGPGASARPAGAPGLHVDAAASAAALAVENGAPGAYNVAEPGPYASVEKARRELGWDPAFRAP